MVLDCSRHDGCICTPYASFRPVSSSTHPDSPISSIGGQRDTYACKVRRVAQAIYIGMYGERGAI